MSESERQRAMKDIHDREVDRHKRLLEDGGMQTAEADREARRFIGACAERADRQQHKG